MTAACGGGPSQIIPGTQQIQNMFSTAIAGALIDGEIDWLAQLASGIGYVTFDLANLCASDPPGYPPISAARIAGYLNPLNPIGAQQLREDVTQVLQTLLWSDYCQCVGGATPVLPPVPPAPPGYQNDNPNVSPPVLAPSCGQYMLAGHQINWSGGGGTISIPLSNNFIIPPNLSGITCTLQMHSASNNPFPISVELHVFPTGTGVSNVNKATGVTLVADQPQTFQVNVPFPTNQIQLILTSPTSTPADFIDMTISGQLWCGGATGQPGEQCCPPDPAVENMLVQIMQLEQLILQQIGAHTAYKRGVTHPGLTGTGTINATGLFGVLIELLSGVPTTPQLPGVPPYQMSVGWVSCLTGDGMIDEIRITRQAQVWSSRLAPFATQFGYQLNPGFTANITELLPA